MKHSKKSGCRHVNGRRASGENSILQSGPKLPEDYPWVVLGSVVDSLVSFIPEEDANLVRSVVRSRNVERIGDLEKAWGLLSINSNAERPPIWVTRSRRLLASVIRKYQAESSEDKALRVETAMKKFMAAESKCAITNSTLDTILLYSDGTPTQALYSLRNEIEQLLGSTVPDEITWKGRHGPGSDTATSASRCSVYVKYSEWPYGVTAGARSAAIQLITSDERWFGALEASYREDLDIQPYELICWDWFWELVLREEDGNRITTVPKDWSEDRPIAIEPRMNMYLQLGVDGYIRSRMRKCWHMNLSSQKKNQELAQEGSVRNDADTPVTVDLSSASDSVSLKLVELLLPPDWFDYLVSLRSPQGELPDGTILHYAKISSMGNGYTWTLESLVFAALARLAVRQTHERPNYDTIAVYGDDIIVPQSSSLPLLHLLSACGFTVNIAKTFLNGDVRESCGTDWVYGQDVRPVHLKKRPESFPDLFCHYNLLLRWFQIRLGFFPAPIHELFMQWIPECVRHFGPPSNEEFASYLFLNKPPKGAYSRYTYCFKCIVTRPKKLPARNFLFRKLMASLRPVGLEEQNPFSARFTANSKGSIFESCQRGRVSYSIAKRQATQWPDFESCPIPDPEADAAVNGSWTSPRE